MTAPTPAAAALRARLTETAPLAALALDAIVETMGGTDLLFGSTVTDLPSFRALHFRHDLAFDSLDMVEFTIALETLLDRDFPDAIVDRWKTVADVLDAVEALA